MRKKFHTYRPPTKEEYKTYWQESLFVPDTNVLVSLYRYPPATKDTLIKIFSKIDQQLWLPYNVGQEFYRNRLETIYDQADAYDQVCAALDDKFETFTKEFKKISIRHPFINSQTITDEISKSIDSIKKKIFEMKDYHPKWSSEDEILDAVEKIFHEKVGDPYEEDKLKGYYAEADGRYRLKIPPGYEDASKDYPNKYGDYIIWRQIIDKAKDTKKSIIFITDDQKEDWWLEINGKTIGPRFELLEEFYKETGVKLLMYQTFRFIDYAKKYFSIEVSADTIAEIEKIEELNKQLKQTVINIEVSPSVDSSVIDSGVGTVSPSTSPSFELVGAGVQEPVMPLKIKKKTKRQSKKTLK